MGSSIRAVTTSLALTCLYFWSRSLLANVGINTVNPVAGLDVATTGSASAAIMPRDSTTNRPASPVNGMIRYNTDANAMELFVNGGWRQISTQPPGSTTNVVPTGPSSTAVYQPTAVTCNYTPGYGSCANLNSGIWLANGSATTSNSTCVQIQGTTSQAVVLDLGSIKTINNIYITYENDSNYSFGQVSFSTDSVTFTSSMGFYAPNYNSGTLYSSAALAPSVGARYVRLMNGAGSANGTRGTFCNLAVGP